MIVVAAEVKREREKASLVHKCMIVRHDNVAEVIFVREFSR